MVCYKDLDKKTVQVLMKIRIVVLLVTIKYQYFWISNLVFLHLFCIFLEHFEEKHTRKFEKIFKIFKIFYLNRGFEGLLINLL